MEQNALIPIPVQDHFRHLLAEGGDAGHDEIGISTTLRKFQLYKPNVISVFHSVNPRDIAHWSRDLCRAEI